MFIVSIATDNFDLFIKSGDTFENFQVADLYVSV